MKYVDEYRDAEVVREYLQFIEKICTKDRTIMEICGGQTHSIVKHGLDLLLTNKINLVHGPGCPVCVTPLEKIDRAVKIASNDDVIFCSFGDMLRVPGSEKDLLTVKSEGADIRIVYSPLDSLAIAKKNPDKKIVFFAVGFETTAPANAMAVFNAGKLNITNFSVLVSQVLVPPAIEFILSSPQNKVNGFLAAGHVCSVMGYEQYINLSEKYKIPFVVTGFEPVDIAQGIAMCVEALEKGNHFVENQYSRVVSRKGNISAQKIMEEVFDISDMKWRGIGEIKNSSLILNKKYSRFDAEKIFNVENTTAVESKDCIAGLIMQGLKKPVDCEMFAKICTPQKPLGATMVSSEGACAAYFKFRKNIFTN